MLRITVHEKGGSWQMQLEGSLAGEYVAEAESAWRSAAIESKRVEIDVSGLTNIDDAGRGFLKELCGAGAYFQARGIATKAMLEGLDHGASHCLWKKVRNWNRVRHLVGVLALVVLAMPSMLRAQDAPLRLTLKDAVNLALKQNPQIAIANLNLIESRENTRGVRSNLLPQVSFTASDDVVRGNPAALLGRTIPGFPGHIGPFWAIQAGPGVSAPVFDLTLWHRWRAAQAMERSIGADQTTARELNAQLVVSQYLGALRASADVTAAKSRLELAKALYEQAADLQKSGVGTGIDSLRANVQYQNERQRSAEADTQLKVALFGLARLLNLDPEQPIELLDEPSFFDTPEVMQNASLVMAYRERPEMQALLAKVRAAEQQKRAAKDERLPKLSVSGGWTLQGLTPGTMIPVYQFGAAIDVPLFTGGRIEAETAIADIEMKKLLEQQKEIRNQIALEVRTAVAQLDSARVEVEAADLGVSLAKEGVIQAQDRFKAGVANNIEVITAQDELARANDNQIMALYRYNQSRADLARATGRMEMMYAN